MAVYKEEKTGTWRVIYRYTDWTGEKKQTQKRGFQTKREAQAWEREQLNKARADLDMTFKSFVEQYTADMQTRIKENTWATKEHIIRSKLLPYFGKLKMSNITAQQIITWQNELMNYKDENGKALSPVYLKTINNQLSAIFNHAVKFYNLKENPCRKAGSMGKKKNREMLFWTKEEYLKFAEVMMDKPQFYYAFEMLYWCGIREGELLALTPADFDFKKGTVSINKSYQRLNGRDVITTPKTEKSNRINGIEWEQKGEHKEHLSVLEFKREKRKEELAELEQSIERVQQQQVSIQAVEQIEAKPLPLSSKVAVDKEDFQNLVTAAQKFVVQEKQEGKLRKLLKDAKKTIADLKAKIESLVTELSAAKAELAQYKSVRGKLRTAELEQENDRLRSRLRTYEDVISRNNLWHFFSGSRGKNRNRDDAR